MWLSTRKCQNCCPELPQNRNIGKTGKNRRNRAYIGLSLHNHNDALSMCTKFQLNTAILSHVIANLLLAYFIRLRPYMYGWFQEITNIYWSNHSDITKFSENVWKGDNNKSHIVWKLLNLWKKIIPEKPGGRLLAQNSFPSYRAFRCTISTGSGLFSGEMLINPVNWKCGQIDRHVAGLNGEFKQFRAKIE